VRLPPEQWEDDAGFQEGRVKLKKLKVVNDGAEREVAMISAFNDSLTKDEETKQTLLQVVKHHHRLHPSSDILNLCNMDYQLVKDP